MLDYLVGLVSRVGHWGYLVIFLAAALESAAFLGVFVPGESLVLVCGFLAAQGALDLDAVIVTVAIGATFGDNLGYELGRRLGRPWIEHYGRRFGLSKERLDRADAFFARHGGKAVFLGRFVGFARAVVPFLAGSSRMPYSQFLLYNALGAILWAIAFIMLGYFAGASWQRIEQWVGAASAILAGVVLTALALAWLGRWAVRRELEIKQRWSAFLHNPRVTSARRRFSPQLQFVRARLSPGGYLGLELTIGALILLGASWLFGGITEDVLSGDPLTVVDWNVAKWLETHSHPVLTRVMLMISMLHGIVPMVVMVVALALFLAARRDWYWLRTLVVCVPGGVLLNTLVKDIVDRPRPPMRDLAIALSTDGFPSGHAATATLVYGFLAAYLFVRVQAWRWRVLVVLTAFFVIALVGLSRVYMRVHYLSDVLAGTALGVAWLALCLTTMDTLRRRAIAPRHR